MNSIIDLGLMSLPWFIKPGDSLPPQAPLTLMRCSMCGLAQLAHTVNPDLLFRTYGYRSGVNATMRNHLNALAYQVKGMVPLTPKDAILDIGCNDGTFLSNFAFQAVTMGFDPADIQQVYTPDYFVKGYFEERKVHSRAKIISTLSMFYDVPDPKGMARSIRDILAPGGVWVCEMNYLYSMIQNMTFDHICHEHLTYWLLGNFIAVASLAGLQVFHAELNGLNGGSIRIYAGHVGEREPDGSVASILGPENDAYSIIDRDLQKKVRLVREAAEEWMAKKLSVAQVWAYGASTRGLTMLHALGLDRQQISAVAERNPEKHGRLYGGTGIPIVSEDAMRAARPDYLLVLPYSFIKEFKERESAYLRAGGRMIVPAPSWQEVSSAE